LQSYKSFDNGGNLSNVVKVFDGDRTPNSWHRTLVLHLPPLSLNGPPFPSSLVKNSQVKASLLTPRTLLCLALNQKKKPPFPFTPSSNTPPQQVIPNPDLMFFLNQLPFPLVWACNRFKTIGGQHKLWLKERPRVKLSTWLPIIKNQELPQITCMKVACHISLERSWQGIQLFFKPHFNRMFTQEVMGLQNGKSPNFQNFETPNLGVLGKMIFGCNPYG
jgi:hypothetical protein